MPILSDMKGGTQMDGTEEKIIEFTAGSVPVAVAAKVYHKDATWVRAGIIKGWLPIGIATRDGKVVTELDDLRISHGRINFYISPKKLYEETGYVWKGERKI